MGSMRSLYAQMGILNLIARCAPCRDGEDGKVKFTRRGYM